MSEYRQYDGSDRRMKMPFCPADSLVCWDKPPFHDGKTLADPLRSAPSISLSLPLSNDSSQCISLPLLK